MTVLLVRHAIALARRDWDGADVERPLTARGERQAAAMVELFRALSIDRIYSSPALRCTDTVRPLARARDLPVKTSKALAEGRGIDAIDLVDKDKHVVVCAHGDNLPELLVALAGHLDDVPPAPPFAKGAAWVLQRRNAKVVSAAYLKPPA